MGNTAQIANSNNLKFNEVIPNLNKLKKAKDPKILQESKEKIIKTIFISRENKRRSKSFDEAEKKILIQHKLVEPTILTRTLRVASSEVVNIFEDSNSQLSNPIISPMLKTADTYSISTVGTYYRRLVDKELRKALNTLQENILDLPNDIKPYVTIGKIPDRHHNENKIIGRGAFSVVYSGLDIPTKRRLAIKEIDLSKLRPNHVKNIWNEIRILSQLNHPNIVKIYGFVKIDSLIYIIMKRCKYGELRKYQQHSCKISEKDISIQVESKTKTTDICKTQPTNDEKSKYQFPDKLKNSEQVVQEILKQLISILEYLYANKIMHRDLKPRNLLVAHQTPLQIRLIDFGLATKFQENVNIKQKVGTPRYMAPEIAYNQEYNFSADLWSLGIILYELLIGFNPFYYCHNFQDMEKNLKTPIEYSPLITDSCLDLLKKLLQIDPQKRLTLTELKNHPWVIKCM